ncbi:restriction endonuclease subunit S [Rhodoferax sp. TBRC 17198]|uniref:restriction endonuclease subunit S n=1 Tax=Rhodoferax potami TaxID=3068338 RepID=UPI0028BD1E6F|nr:restriction endonuclease subunit S [Rhodoferax sp. TBRC 17198]MDT7520926.1 restriction endonuclease subunit S [Rhodoferax sp. TBRC 17198]
MNNYESYRDVQSFWMDKAPSHWKSLKNKHVFTQKKEIVGENWESFTLLTMGKGGVKPRDMDGGGKFPESFEGYQVVNPDQLIFCLFDLDETPRTVGLSKDHGMITSAYDVFSTREGNDPKYWTYFYQTIDDHKGLRPYYTGLRKVVRYDTFMGIDVYSPPLEEQNLISCYLDKKTSQIDSLINKIEKKIELLKEQRTSLINQYVTKGLNPNVEMKDSGDEWIGEIPKHWGVQKLKYLVTYNTETLDENTDSNYEFHYIEIGDVDYLDGVSISPKINFSESPSRARRIVKPKDVIISTVRTYLRAIGVVPEVDDVICSTGFCVLRDQSGYLDQDFLSFTVKSEWFISKVIGNSYGVSYPAINSSELVELKITLPPLDEQKAIVEHLQINISKFDRSIQLEEKRKSLLGEYRQSLISSAVTGKVKVTEKMI